MSVSIHFYLLRGLNYQSPNFKRLQIIVNACILLYYMSKVYSFCFLFFYFNCSTYVTREQPPGATFPFSRAKVQKINEICNLIPQNIFYRVYLTPAIHVIALDNTSPILAGSYGSRLSLMKGLTMIMKTLVQVSLASAKTNVMILSNSFFPTKEEEN